MRLPETKTLPTPTRRHSKHSPPLLSVIVPIYNERDTLPESLASLLKSSPSKEIILVDDASTDGSDEAIRRISIPCHVTTRFHATNQGKGAAIRTAIPLTTGKYVVVHDADLEYAPVDLQRLIDHLETNQADAVYGSRFPPSSWRSDWHACGNRLISILFSLVTGVSVSDVETCYKVIRREQLLKISDQLRESRFGIEIEMTARLAAIGTRFCEAPIRYRRRGYGEGKKIGWRDAFSALRCIFQYGFPVRCSRRAMAPRTGEKAATKPDSH